MQFSMTALRKDPANILSRFLLYTAIFIVGAVFTKLFDIQTRVMPLSGIMSIVERIGWVSWAMVPLSIYALYPICHDILHIFGVCKNAAKPFHYDTVISNAPILGMIGTIYGFTHSLILNSNPENFQDIYTDMGQALFSTLYGLVLLFLMKTFGLILNKEFRLRNEDGEK